MMRPPATVVIPVWNAWEHTRRCLDSLRPTLGLRDQVVVVDNGSTDATAVELARRPWLTVISNAENRGFAAACNQGAAAATTDIVVFLNNDTLTPSRWIDSLLTPLADAAVVASGPRSNAVSGPQLVAGARYDGSKLAEVQRFARTWRETNRGTTEVERLVGFCLAVKASAFAEVGGFDERFEVGGYEDDDLCLRLRDAGGRLVIAHASFVHHVGHSTFDANEVDWFALQERNRTVLEAKHRDEANARGGLISACLIVRDEADNLPACLASLAGLVDEVVVYDTGSVDGTPELAEAAGAKLVRGYWDDDFARARNAALAECDGTWILWIDADEAVECDDTDQLRARLGRAKGFDGYLLTIANEVGDGTGARSHFFAPRLFRRERLRWSGRIHEQLLAVDGTKVEWRRGLDLQINHAGYLDAVMIGRNKAERNLRLAQLSVTEDPGDLVGWVNLGRTLLVAGRYAEALEACTRVTARQGVDTGVLRRALQASAEAALRMRAWDRAGEAIESLRAMGGAEIAVAELASRHAVAAGDPARALAELDVLRPGLRDADGGRMPAGRIAEIRAQALYGLNRPSAAADVLLDAVRAGDLERGSLPAVAIYLRWAGRSLDELVLAADGDYRGVLLASVAELSAAAATELMDALWRAAPDDLSVLVVAAGNGARLPVEAALSWSDRLRSQGLDEHCPLVAIAGSEARTPQDRLVAGALASAVFADDRGLPYFGRAAAAVIPAERRAVLDTLAALCPAALPLAQALYTPDLPALPAAGTYTCSIVLPVIADLSHVLPALEAIAASSEGERAEVVCVFDGMDAARAALMAGLGGDLRVVQLPVETGLAHAFNVGIAAAAGDVVILVHPAGTVAAGWIDAAERLVGAADFAVGGAAAVPVLVAAGRNELLALNGADARLVDDAVLPDLVDRLRESGRSAGYLPPALAGWQQGPSPDRVLPRVPAGRVLWSPPPPVQPPAEARLADVPTVGPRVRVHGFLNGEMGLGQAARGLVESLERAGVTVATHSYGGHSNRNEHPFAQRPDDGDGYPVDLLCFNADHVSAMLTNGQIEVHGGYTIALWYWELETIPDWMVAGLQHVDEVWVGSDFIRDALRRVTRKPVVTVPPPVTAHLGRPTITRSELGLPDGFSFGFMFDHNSTMARKNPIGLVRAFREAFAPGEGPHLVIKAINSASWPENQARLVAAVGDRRDITILERYLPSQQSAAFTGLFDCWVSLHRSEGFGLTMAEAMGWGTPVIGTGYSANLDFMDPTNSHLVPAVPTPVEAGVAAYSEGEWWAEPDVQAAARVMRQVWSDPAAAAELGERGRQTIATRYGAAAVGAIARARLDVIAADLRTPAVSRP